MIFHVLNLGNDQRTIFGDDDDYAAFLRLFGQTQEAAPMRILAYRLLSFFPGDEVWQQRAAEQLGLEFTLRPRGRPRKKQ
jgi:hypothetical protein